MQPFTRHVRALCFLGNDAGGGIGFFFGIVVDGDSSISDEELSQLLLAGATLTIAIKMCDDAATMQ